VSDTRDVEAVGRRPAEAERLAVDADLGDVADIAQREDELFNASDPCHWVRLTIRASGNGLL
jgi:hypothetical protein